MSIHFNQICKKHPDLYEINMTVITSITLSQSASHLQVCWTKPTRMMANKADIPLWGIILEDLSKKITNENEQHIDNILKLY